MLQHILETVVGFLVLAIIAALVWRSRQRKTHESIIATELAKLDPLLDKASGGDIEALKRLNHPYWRQIAHDLPEYLSRIDQAIDSGERKGWFPILQAQGVVLKKATASTASKVDALLNKRFGIMVVIPTLTAANCLQAYQLLEVKEYKDLQAIVRLLYKKLVAELLQEVRQHHRREDFNKLKHLIRYTQMSEARSYGLDIEGSSKDWDDLAKIVH